MNSYRHVRELSLEVDRYEIEGLSQTTKNFLRHTTLVHLHGVHERGTGEDVNYDGAEQLEFQSEPPRLSLSGAFTLESFSKHLDTIQLFKSPPKHPSSIDYRRWAFESAALDLALRQNGKSLEDALGIKARPLTFVLSMGLGSPPHTKAIRAALAHNPDARFKLDANPLWSEEFIAELADLDRVDVIDFKGAYHGTAVDQPGEPKLYARVAKGLAKTWLEDPDLNPETTLALAGFEDRVTWDAPIHAVRDIVDCAWPPRCLNIKPSRFGTLERLLSAYDYCARENIQCYGGGQFELGPGRGQIQYLASLFHADSPNDVAPSVYNRDVIPLDAPKSPLSPKPQTAGFSWSAQ